MPIHYTEDRWSRIRETYDAWWEHRLDRPVIPVKLKGLDPGRPQPKAPVLSQATALDLSWTAEELIDRLDYELSQIEFLGDAFPYFNMDVFGPGVAAAYMGSTPRLGSTGHIWFQPADGYKELSELHFEYDPDNIWLKRTKEIYHAANAKWHGQVVMGMVDLGGNLDILASFRGTENLLMDLYDEPEEVQRCIREIEALWFRYYEELNEILEECNKGYADWSKIYSSKRSYVPQSDFCYMIGNPMFKEFVAPQLSRFANRIPNTIYHLDGPGELTHMEDFMNMNFNAIQWVKSPETQVTQWPDVFKRIAASGKGIQVWGGVHTGPESIHEQIDTIAEQIGTRKGLLYNDYVDDISKREQYIEMLEKYGVEI